MCELPDHDESREESGDERGFLGATELDLVQNERHNGLLGSTGTQEGTHTSGSGRRLSTKGQRARWPGRQSRGWGGDVSEAELCGDVSEAELCRDVGGARNSGFCF